jgi:hypothetical protein
MGIQHYTDEWKTVLADCYGEHAAQINGAIDVMPDEIDLLERRTLN